MKVIALSGLTECGKYTAARYFEKYGVARLKIGEMLMPLYRRSRSTMPFQEWNFHAERSSPNELFDGLIAELDAYSARHRVAAMSIDSLYGPVLARHLRARLGTNALVLYIDAPFAVRLARQVESAGVSPAEARAILDEKDASKRQRGNLDVRALADEIVDNAGPMETFTRQLDAIYAQRIANGG